MIGISQPYNCTNDTQEIVSNSNKSISSLSTASTLEQSIALKCSVFVLSLSTVLVNTFVIKTVFTTPHLKRINTMFLAAQIAICDFLIGGSLLPGVICASIPKHEKGERFLDIWARYVCPTVLSTRSTALLLEPFFLFLMTVHRYKVIVNYSKPWTHLTKNFIFSATCIAWLASITLVGGSALGFAQTNRYEGFLCRRIPSSKNYDIYIEKTGIGINALLLILCGIMYFRIYKKVKYQNVIMEAQTYKRVSKLIFALVISTMVLWYVPAMIVAFIGNRNADQGIRTLTILISFTTNSLINPFLYVFRDTKFRRSCFPCTRHVHETNQNIPGKPSGTSKKKPCEGEQWGSNHETNEVNCTSL